MSEEKQGKTLEEFIEKFTDAKIPEIEAKRIQEPLIVFDEKKAKIFCVTRYINSPGKKIPVQKFDITEKLNTVLDKVYLKAVNHARRNMAPIKRTHIVCLCGSTKFRKEFEEITEKFTMDDFIVLSVGAYGHEKAIPFSESVKRQLDQLHFRKIEMADLVFIINREGYIGESTRNEIDYATSLGKQIQYMVE